MAADAKNLVLHRRRRPIWHPVGVLQIIAALWFSSYFCFWLVALLAVWSLVQLGALSASSAAVLVLAYLGQIVVYRPQNSTGWPFAWFLYSGVVDLVLGYYNATCIREGPPLDPQGRYLFAMSPHGIFGVCRAFSGGSLWRQMYGDIRPRWGSFGGAFFIPGVREFSLCSGLASRGTGRPAALFLTAASAALGCLDASRPVLERAIARGEHLASSRGSSEPLPEPSSSPPAGESVMLIPGGTRELMLTDGHSTTTKLVLLGRKGFVKLAIRHGLQLVPGFCFGEMLGASP